VPHGYDTAGLGPQKRPAWGVRVPETRSSQDWRATCPRGWTRTGATSWRPGACWPPGTGWPTRPGEARAMGRRPGLGHRGELDAAGARVAGRLGRAGLAAGDRVLVSAATPWTWSWLYLGALRMGLVVVSVNTLTRNGRWPTSSATPGRRRPWSTTPSGAAGALGGRWRPARRRPAAPGRRRPLRPALLCDTSGTTGAPEGGRARPRESAGQRRGAPPGLALGPTDRLVLALSLFHVHRLGVGLHGTLLAGASAVLPPWFEGDTVLDAAGDHRAALFFGCRPCTPGWPARPGPASRAAAAVRVGSAPLPSAVFARLAERAGQRVLEHGMTETVMNVSNLCGGYKVHPLEVEELLAEHRGGRGGGVGTPRRSGASRSVPSVPSSSPPTRPPRPTPPTWSPSPRDGWPVQAARFVRYVEA
jgi:hypothetical protein